MTTRPHVKKVPKPLPSGGPLETDAGNLIWVTGFSSSGKTTVARFLCDLLRDEGLGVVWLDGDDLRRIFAQEAGYDRDGRLILGARYFELCSYLVRQGHVVLISTVAMYQTLLEKVRQEIPDAFVVRLEAPEAERVGRDELEGKRVYQTGQDFAKLYDSLDDVDLVLQNTDSVSPQTVASQIVEAFLERSARSREVREAHWNSFYSFGNVRMDPTPFANHVSGQLKPSTRILEIGAGNGRDSAFFASLGHSVTAVDSSFEAVRRFHRDFPDSVVNYEHGTAKTLLETAVAPTFDAIYCRFVLHAMGEGDEVETLAASFELLCRGGSMWIEARSSRDPMANLGEKIGPNEAIFGHYRRFIVRDELVGRLEQIGFTVISSEESSGLAVFGDEDPVVIRVHAVRGV